MPSALVATFGAGAVPCDILEHDGPSFQVLYLVLLNSDDGDCLAELAAEVR